MDRDIPDSINASSLHQRIVHLSGLIEQMQAFLHQTRPASIPKVIYEGVTQVDENLGRMRVLVRALEAERKNMLALGQMSQYINSSLELDEVLQIVMDTIIHLTKAERGFLMLPNEQGKLSIRVARNWEQESLEQTEWAVSHTVINRVVNSGMPVLTTDAQEDPRFNGKDSVVANQLRSILCVPLKVKGDLIGVMYTDNRIRSGIFTVKERDLLAGFANQAAVAIENARLFDSVRRTLSEVTELKSLTDNVFASIASGVLTADNTERIVMCNRAAEEILGIDAERITGCHLADILPVLSPLLEPYLDRVRRTNEPVLGLEASPTLPIRGQVNLRFSLSPLKDAQQDSQGVAIVIEDLTEKKQLEAQRRLFERMVSPAVIERLDPNRLQLGGQRAEITVLFADLRGFTQFSEMVQPEELVAVLNRHLAAAADAVMNEGGTVDKFLGDAVMAWFNAPVPQPDHTIRAVRAALAVRSVVERLHKILPSVYRLSYGIGIHAGEAVLGLVGTEKRLDYTAIGDSVNTAKRIQESAAPGQILISQEVYALLNGQVKVGPVEPVYAKGKREPLAVYEVLGLVD